MNVRAFKNFLGGNGWKCTGGANDSYWTFEKKNSENKLQVFYHRDKVFSVDLQSRAKVIKIEIRRGESFISFADIVKDINSYLIFKSISFEKYYDSNFL